MPAPQRQHPYTSDLTRPAVRQAMWSVWVHAAGKHRVGTRDELYSTVITRSRVDLAPRADPWLPPRPDLPQPRRNRQRVDGLNVRPPLKSRTSNTATANGDGPEHQRERRQAAAVSNALNSRSRPEVQSGYALRAARPDAWALVMGGGYPVQRMLKMIRSSASSSTRKDRSPFSPNWVSR